MRTLRAALTLLRERGVMTLTPQPGLRSLVGEVTGGPVRGSFWAHPKGKLIYALATRLEDAPGVLSAKLAGGKTTFVDRSLWPALYRVVTDRAWSRARRSGLPPLARRIAAAVARARGGVRLETLTTNVRGGKSAVRKAKAALERACILHVTSEHTESGRHATVLRAWTGWASADVRAAAARLAFDDAVAALAARGLSL